MPTLLCYSRCSTCRGVIKALEEKEFSFISRDIKEDNPSAQELAAWHEASGLPLKRFFNTSGGIYRDLGLKDKLADMSDQDQYDLLAKDGMLVKRPILLLDDGQVRVGPDVKKFAGAL